MFLTNNQIQGVELTQFNIRTIYLNNAEKPQQNTVKNHCEKALGNAIAKPKQYYCKMPKQNHGKTNKEYAEGMQNTTKK